MGRTWRRLGKPASSWAEEGEPDSAEDKLRTHLLCGAGQERVPLWHCTGEQNDTIQRRRPQSGRAVLTWLH